MAAESSPTQALLEQYVPFLVRSPTTPNTGTDREYRLQEHQTLWHHRLRHRRPTRLPQRWTNRYTHKRGHNQWRDFRERHWNRNLRCYELLRTLRYWVL